MKRIIALPLLVGVCASRLVFGQLVDEDRRKEAVKRYRAGQEFMFAEAWEKARVEFAAAVRLDPLLTLAHYGLGQSNMALKQYREAVQAYSGCRDAYLTLAAIEQSQGRDIDRLREQEIRELKDALSLVQSGRVKMANAGAFSGMKLDERIKELERMRGRERRAGTQFSVPAEVYLALGSAHFRSGSLADAEREYTEAVRINAKFGEAHNNLAVVYMLTGRYTEAEASMRAAEKAGFRVNPRFKEDLKKASKQ